jgi:hypothetical protein
MVWRGRFRAEVTGAARCADTTAGMFWILAIVAASAGLLVLSTTGGTLAVAERLLGTYAQLLAAAREAAAADKDGDSAHGR